MLITLLLYPQILNKDEFKHCMDADQNLTCLKSNMSIGYVGSLLPERRTVNSTHNIDIFREAAQFRSVHINYRI